MKKFDFTNKTVIITGANSGIGKCLAQILITKFNAKIIAVARNEEKLNAVKQELGDNYLPYPFSVDSFENWQNFANTLINQGVTVDALINCAGVLPTFNKFENVTVNDYLSVININFLSTVYSTKIFLPILKSNGDGVIINVSSSSALCPFAGVSSYSASKVALERFSTCLAVEEKVVSITTVMPGFTKTNVMRSQSQTEKERGIIDKISANPYKVANKIIKKASKRKRRVITGIDAHFMNFLYKFFPNSAPKILTWFLKKSNFSTFKDI